MNIPYSENMGEFKKIGVFDYYRKGKYISSSFSVDGRCNLKMKNQKSKKIILITVMVIIIVVLGSSMIIFGKSMISFISKSDDTKNGNNTKEPVDIETDKWSIDGHTSEGSTYEYLIDFPVVKLLWISFTLTWTDDIGSNDRFSFEIDEGSFNDKGTSTEGEIILEFFPNGSLIESTWDYKVTAEECPGEYFNLPLDRDRGNDWTITVEYTSIDASDDIP